MQKNFIQYFYDYSSRSIYLFCHYYYYYYFIFIYFIIITHSHSSYIFFTFNLWPYILTCLPRVCFSCWNHHHQWPYITKWLFEMFRSFRILFIGLPPAFAVFFIGSVSPLGYDDDYYYYFSCVNIVRRWLRYILVIIFFFLRDFETFGNLWSKPMFTIELILLFNVCGFPCLSVCVRGELKSIRLNKQTNKQANTPFKSKLFSRIKFFSRLPFAVSMLCK